MKQLLRETSGQRPQLLLQEVAVAQQLIVWDYPTLSHWDSRGREKETCSEA